MHRIWVSGGLLVLAVATAAVGASSAGAFEGGISPQIPGIGSASGLDGPPPVVEVHGGRAGVRQGGTTWVEVTCTTSTGRGCAGTMQLTSGGMSAGSAPFELAERQSQGVYVRLSRVAQRKTRRATGLKLIAKACAADNLGRSACDAAAVSIHSNR